MALVYQAAPSGSFDVLRKLDGKRGDRCAVQEADAGRWKRCQNREPSRTEPLRPQCRFRFIAGLAVAIKIVPCVAVFIFYSVVIWLTLLAAAF
jgi:hypothetical protein